MEKGLKGLTQAYRSIQAHGAETHNHDISAAVPGTHKHHDSASDRAVEKRHEKKSVRNENPQDAAAKVETSISKITERRSQKVVVSDRLMPRLNLRPAFSLSQDVNVPPVRQFAIKAISDNNS